jgi:16S rRNA (adenine1518-N6/adenine1519-N6)-dimethyltransferase
VTHSRPAIRSLLESGGLAPRRELGQNFMVDPNTVRRIVDLADISADDHVVEIGAGLGSLTLGLATTGADITAVEVDEGLAATLVDLTETLSNVHVIIGDAMTIDWNTMLGTAPHVLVANLPYNIATPLVCDLLDEVPAIERMLVLVQDEAADRFVAPPGSRQYGAVSVKIAHHGIATKVGRVPATVFLPKPNVESALVDIRRRSHPEAEGVEIETMHHLVRTAFGQRRKMLRRSLDGVVSPEQFADANIEPTDRPEQLGLVDWYRLTRVVQQ